MADNDVAKVKPSLTNCSVISIRSLQLLCSVKHNVTLQWIMAKDVMKEVDNYYLYCKCHDYKTGVTKIVSDSKFKKCICNCNFVHSIYSQELNEQIKIDSLKFPKPAHSCTHF